MMGQGDNYDYNYARKMNEADTCGCWKGYEARIAILKKKIEKLKAIIRNLNKKSNKAIQPTAE